MILTILLPALERIINTALKCDPEATHKLKKIKNQSIKIDCIDWQFQFVMLIDENGLLQFHQKYFHPENIAIKSTLNNFLHIFMKGADSKTLFDYPIDISGNPHVLEVLRDAFKNLDLDLEEKLSTIIGDAAAFKIFSHARRVKNITSNTNTRLTEQLKEYIYFEAKHFPTRKQVESFYHDIAKLRNDVARLEAKIREHK